MLVEYLENKWTSKDSEPLKKSKATQISEPLANSWATYTISVLPKFRKAQFWFTKIVPLG